MISPEMMGALTDAVRTIEARSCAEVVVEVRSRSGSYAHAESRFAALVAFGGLIVLLFSPWPFAPVWVALDVALLYAAGLMVARRSNFVRRRLTLRSERDGQVRTAAATVFHDRGVGGTERETGLLVYLSLLERRVEVLADRGVLLSVPASRWTRFVEEARGCGGTVPALVDLLHDLAPLLAECLPVHEGDRDELANAPWFTPE